MTKLRTHEEYIEEMESRIKEEKEEIESIQSTIRNQELMIDRLKQEIEWAKQGDDSWA